MMQQAVEQKCIRSRRDRQMQIGDVAGGGAPRVDHHHLHFGARLLRRREALVQHRMRPGIVGTDQHDEVGQLDILVTHRHRIRAERALVRGHRRRHAQPRIGIDVRAADETLHQLVRDVIILGQQLPGDIERHRIRPVLCNDFLESARRHDPAPRPRSRAVHRRWGKASGLRYPASGPAPCPWNTAGRNWPDAVYRLTQSRLHPQPSPPRRSRRRNTGRWCEPVAVHCQHRCLGMASCLPVYSHLAPRSRPDLEKHHAMRDAHFMAMRAALHRVRPQRRFPGRSPSCAADR